MANTVSRLSYANTFGDWVVTTNALVNENNELAANNYIKPTGTLFLNEPTLGLQVANTAIISGQLQVQGIGSSAYIQNNLRVDTQVYFTNTSLGLTNSGELISHGKISATGSGTGLAVANNVTVGGTINVTGTSTLNGKTTVADILEVTDNAFFDQNIIVTDKVTGSSFYANNDLSTGSLTVRNDAGIVGTTYTSTLQANTSANTETLSVTGYALVDTLQANSSVNTATASVTGELFANTITANSGISVPNITIDSYVDANSAVGYFDSIQTVGQVSVGGNFVINGTTVYSSNTFTLSADSTSGQVSYVNVNRGTSGANASIRWNESSKYWDILDVNTGGSYSKILTANGISDSVLSTSSDTMASSKAANTLNNSIVTANNSMKLYVDGVNSTLTNVNIYAAAGYGRANTSSNTFTGTTGSASPSNGNITYSSNNGVVISGVGNSLYINTPQDIRTSGSPTFNGLTLTNALPINQGGTGQTSASDALTALLPTGTTSGYVLTTGGPGTFYWAAGGTGGGGGATPGTTINSTRLSYTGNGSGLSYTTPTYTPGASQLRIFIDGVRQFASEYTETSNTIVTFNTSPPSGSAILMEVDGYIVNPYYANNITFTAPQGNIPESANTIQLAIADLESRKASLSSPAFTGIATSTTPSTNTSNTQIATTAFVKNALNSGNTFAIGVSGNAGTVTDGVYTTGDQTITGIKTFTSGIVANVTGNVVGNASTVTNGVYTMGVQVIGGNKTFTSDIYIDSLGVGTNASSVSGEIRATNNITAYYSDDRLKTKLGNIENALDKVSSLNGFYYEANETAQALGYKVKKEVGVSAQEVQAILPQVVVPAPIDEQYLTVHYDRLVPLLIEAIKELKSEIDVLKGNNK